MLHKCRALRAVYVSMAQAVDMYYVKIEADDGYLQLQLNDNTVLVSTFSFNYDKNVFSKTLNLPGGLTVRYGNVQDKETGYIPFVSTVNNRNVKILSTGAEVLQKFFQG